MTYRNDAYEDRINVLHDELRFIYQDKVPQGWRWSTFSRRWEKTFGRGQNYTLATVSFVDQPHKQGGMGYSDNNYRWHWAAYGDGGMAPTPVEAFKYAGEAALKWLESFLNGEVKHPFDPGPKVDSESSPETGDKDERA